MRILPLTGALALVLAAAAPTALSAQDSMTWTTEQMADMATWPADRQATFKTWPMDYQMYYWTLTPTQRTGYWRLTNEQRAQIAALTPEQRVAAWQSIEAQMNGMANRATPATGDGTPATPSPMASDTAMATPSRMESTTGNMTPPPASAMNKTYPLCSRTVTDSCQNPGEGGAPGRSRALKYWPGKPASEGGR